VARISVVVLAAIGALATTLMPSIAGAWKFLASITAGTGLILLLRWLWWRINVWSEISVMIASLVGANALLVFSDVPFPFSLALVVAGAVPLALAITLLTPPEDLEHLRSFYERVRPAGWWGPVARAAGLPPQPLGLRAVAQVLAATLGVYGLLLGVGFWLFGEVAQGVAAVALGGAALAWSIRTPREQGEPS
jgi:hypothetical protein